MKFRVNRFLFLVALVLPVFASCKTMTAFEKEKPAVRSVVPAVSETEKSELKKLADDGDITALVKLGDMEENESLALKWYCEAARQGDGVAQYKVGSVYSRQYDVVPQKTGRPQLVAAMMWLDMAILNGQDEASDLRKKLGKAANRSDFGLYGEYTRMGISAPCEDHEVKAPRQGILKQPDITIEKKNYDE